MEACLACVLADLSKSRDIAVTSESFNEFSTHPNSCQLQSGGMIACNCSGVTSQGVPLGFVP